MVIKQLKSLYNGLYTERNVGISGTHTHSGPGGFHQYLLYDITSLGFVKESFDALVAGIVEDSNINRSPTAYLLNPEAERQRYKYDVDKNMTLLRIEDAQGLSIGMIKWVLLQCMGTNSTNPFWNFISRLIKAPTQEQVSCQKPKPILLDTGEEQRYEGASTIYGPHTLQAYIQKFQELAVAIAKGSQVAPGPNPPNLLDKQISFLPPVLYDTAPIGRNFGDLRKDASPSYTPTNDTFLTVEQKQADGTWKVMFTDRDWETRYKWEIESLLLGESNAIIRWDIPEHMQDGTYRIRHFGTSKSMLGTMKPFEGKTREFLVKT
nr:hypothetical protein BaRGS_003876 [Batillaria attramentaria]